MNGEEVRNVDHDARTGPERRLHPSDALAIIQYLDELRERLWADYGDDIVAEFGADANTDEGGVEEQQIDLAFEDGQVF